MSVIEVPKWKERFGPGPVESSLLSAAYPLLTDVPSTNKAVQFVEMETSPTFFLYKMGDITCEMHNIVLPLGQTFVPGTYYVAVA